MSVESCSSDDELLRFQPLRPCGSSLNLQRRQRFRPIYAGDDELPHSQPEFSRHEADLIDLTDSPKGHGSDSELCVPSLLVRDRSRLSGTENEPEPPTAVPKKKAKRSSEEEKAARKSEREVERERKRLEKESERAEKRTAREANRKRSDAELLNELTLRVDPGLLEAGGGAILADLQARMPRVEVRALVVGGSLEWLRDGRTEPFVAVRVPGEQLVRLVAAPDQLFDWARHATEAHPGRRLWILVEGLAAHLNELDREVHLQNRARVEAGLRAAAGGGRGRSTSAAPDREALERALVWLQVEAKCQVWRSESVQESAELLARLTLAVARRRQRPEARFEGFCAEAVCKGGRDVWQAQLRQVPGLGEDAARAIARAYPTPRHLLDQYSPASALTPEQKRRLLADLPILRADGSFAKRRIGPVLSERIYRLFTEQDPDLLIA